MISNQSSRHSCSRRRTFLPRVLFLGVTTMMPFGLLSTGIRRTAAWTTTPTTITSRCVQRALNSIASESVYPRIPRTFGHLGSEMSWLTMSPKSSSSHPSTTTCQFKSRLFSTSSEAVPESDSLFCSDSTTFASIGVSSPVLLDRLSRLGLERPTKVQATSFEQISQAPSVEDSKKQRRDVIIGSETGSGKTLAYLLPILQDILQQKQQLKDGQISQLSYDYARAIILVPNKELVQQVLRMAIPLCGGIRSVVWTGGVKLNSLNDNVGQQEVPDHSLVRLAVLPGGLGEPLDYKPFRDTIALGGGTEPPLDIIVSTPAALGPLGLKPKNIDMFADIQTLVVDEADMLLDGGYIRPLENVLMGFRRADRLDPSLGVQPTQHVFCAATLPDMGLKSVDAYLQRKFPYAERVQMSGMHNARHYGLKQATEWIEMETKKERMERLVDLLEMHVEEGGLLSQKVMVFLNSVEDVEGAQGALDRAGISSVPYHAKIALEERSQLLDRFRRYDSQHPYEHKDAVPVLVCTDLASRGLDVPGVNAVVQLQFSGNVVSHLHRMGRCGRAGQRTGRGIVFYGGTERELVEVVQQAEEQQERMVLQGDVDDRLDDEDEEAGKVKKAFSRKRGFTKKRKKLNREAP